MNPIRGDFLDFTKTTFDGMTCRQLLQTKINEEDLRGIGLSPLLTNKILNNPSEENLKNCLQWILNQIKTFPSGPEVTKNFEHFSDLLTLSISKLVRLEKFMNHLIFFHCLSRSNPKNHITLFWLKGILEVQEVTLQNLFTNAYVQQCTNLIIEDSPITALPENIGDYFPNLRYVIIVKTNIEQIPNSIGKLPLIQFELSDSPVKSLPSTISNCCDLKILLLGNLKLTEFPSDILLLTKLEILRLETPLDAIPFNIRFFSKLRFLTIIELRTKVLPGALFYLTNLEGLILPEDVILENLRSFELMKNLQVLCLSNFLFRFGGVYFPKSLWEAYVRTENSCNVLDTVTFSKDDKWERRREYSDTTYSIYNRRDSLIEYDKFAGKTYHLVLLEQIQLEILLNSVKGIK